MIKSEMLKAHIIIVQTIFFSSQFLLLLWSLCLSLLDLYSQCSFYCVFIHSYEYFFGLWRQFTCYSFFLLFMFVFSLILLASCRFGVHWISNIYGSIQINNNTTRRPSVIKCNYQIAIELQVFDLCLDCFSS